MPLSPLSHRTKNEQVYLAMREAIIDGDLSPSDKITISSLAEWLGVSESPVREALTRLESEGLVSIRPYHSIAIVPVSAEKAEEVLSVRLILEPYAAKYAAERADDMLVADLQQRLAELDMAAARHDYAAYGRLNRAFHEAIYAHCGNETLAQMISELWDVCERSRSVFRYTPERAEHSVSEHDALVKAIEARDGQAAYEVTKEQKQASFLGYVDRLRQSPAEVDQPDQQQPG